MHITSSAVRPKNVLLVDDNASDVRLFREALNSCPTQLLVRLAADGEAALNLLFQEHYEPDLIILDLNLPKISGYEVLRRVKESPLQQTPIVVFSSAPNREEPPHANAYIKTAAPAPPSSRASVPVGRAC
jgi:CheY-like chemotaxis protein